MSEEIIFMDTTGGLEFYSDGTSNVTREQLQHLKQENEFLIGRCETLLNHNEEKALCWIEFQGCKKENELLKSELHSKTEYIQEQRDVIEQYRNEIKMYKKCRGKRASKRETDLRKALKEIKEIIVEWNNCCVEPPAMKFKCSECKEKMMDKINDIINEVSDE